MRIVFMGTPEFAVPSLKALYDARHDIAGVITQPDRPSGRGHKLQESPVKVLARSLGLDVYQFERLRKQEGLDCVRALKPELIATAAFGQLLSKKILEVPRMGTINVHASLLPKHRGAAPINWSIILGERVTGITTMLTDAGLDTGDMLLKREVAIGDNETAGELTARLAQVGAQLLIETIDKFVAGEITPIKQNEADMSYDRILDKELGRVDWSKPARDIFNLIRGVNPSPGAYTTLDGQALKIWSSRVIEGEAHAPISTVICSSAKEGLYIACGGGTILEIVEMQAPSSKRMNAKAYLAGKRIETGIRLGE